MVEEAIYILANLKQKKKWQFNTSLSRDIKRRVTDCHSKLQLCGKKQTVKNFHLRDGQKKKSFGVMSGRFLWEGVINVGQRRKIFLGQTVKGEVEPILKHACAL